MINLIIKSISVRLDAELNGCEINIEEKKEGLKEPCFFVLCINSTNKLFLNRRYFRTNQFCIQYIPECGGREKAECYEVAERLFDCLEWLEVGGNLVMGTKMKYEVVDGVLHFFVNYDMFVYKVEESVPVMEEVSSETLLKG